ncbi:Ig-like domain-containing protein [uncultured Deinococcus sp.]|uniref:Ig-like domain-containing protein n=1 Tax=uncultured Deinococcus sp. TaxID=158789 RepID=UPI002590CD50|nr:Ig-like domain-containing protein [uncultured Deinococcus sp.]
MTLLAALALAAAPRLAQKPPVACPAVLTPPVAVTLKNERGLADASAPLFAPQREAEIRVRREGQGRYTVSVQRQGYRPVTLRRVRVEVNECGPAEPTPPTIRLTPVPNAPTVRRFVVLGPRDLRVGSWPFYQRYTAFVDAPAGQREVVWSSSNPDVATVDQTGMLRSVCSREGG